jgi:hypothetical protein
MIKVVAEVTDMPAETRAAAVGTAVQFGKAAAIRCQEDGWTVAARNCIAKAREEKDFEPCEHELSHSQQQLLQRDMKRVMESMGPAGGDELAASTEPQPMEATGPIYQDTGIRACNDYLRTIEQFSACDKVPQSARDALIRSTKAMRDTWASLRDPALPPEAIKAATDGCQTALDGLKAAMAAAGCPR